MFFGQYLLQKKLITSSQLVQAMASQFESRPSILRVIQEKQIISDDQLATAINQSFSENKSVENILLESNTIDSVTLNDLIFQATKKGLGLGRALVQIGAIDSEKLNEALRDYLKNKPEDAIDTRPAPTAEKIEDNNAEVEISSAALESLKELGITDESELAELESTIDAEIPKPEATEVEVAYQEDTNASTSDEEVAISEAALESLKELGITDGAELTELEQKVEAKSTNDSSEQDKDNDELEISQAALDSLKELGISDSKEIAELETKVKGLEFEGVNPKYVEAFNNNIYDKLKDDIKTLAKGFNADVLNDLHSEISKFMIVVVDEGHKFTEKLYHCYQKVFEAVLDKKIDFSNINFLEFATTTKEAVNLAWDLKQAIADGGNEEALINDNEWKQKYLDNLKRGLALINPKE